MAYSRVTRTQNGRGAIEYAEGKDGRGHNDKKVRNQVVGYVNMIPGIDAADQMQPYWNLARKNHKIQVLRIVQSFSKKEFNPQNPMAIERANIVGQEFARTYYPNRQCVIYTQIDGKGGYVHNHILVNDVEMTTHKGCDKEQYHYSAIERWTDEITSKYTKLDSGRDKTADKITQTERAKREKGEYSWKDDLKSRIRETMEKAESEDDFIQKLPESGVNIEVHDSKRGKKRGRYYTYELMDFSSAPEDTKLPKNAKCRSYKLGTLYDAEAVKDFYIEREIYMKRNHAAGETDSVKKPEPDMKNNRAVVADTSEQSRLNQVAMAVNRAAEEEDEQGVIEQQVKIYGQYTGEEIMRELYEKEKRPDGKMTRQEFMDAHNLTWVADKDGHMAIDWNAKERIENMYQRYLAGENKDEIRETEPDTVKKITQDNRNKEAVRNTKRQNQAKRYPEKGKDDAGKAAGKVPAKAAVKSDSAEKKDGKKPPQSTGKVESSKLPGRTDSHLSLELPFYARKYSSDEMLLALEEKMAEDARKRHKKKNGRLKAVREDSRQASSRITGLEIADRIDRASRMKKDDMEFGG